MKKLSNEEFIKLSKKTYSDEYDYSKVEYVNSSTKVCIICPKHGEFWKTPENFLHKTRPQGCPFCSKERKKYNQLDNNSFIEKAKLVHGNKFDYSKVEYINNSTKVCIICPKHGEFLQTPSNHLSGRGCPKCRYENSSLNQTKTKEKFINDCKKVHGDKYDYSKVEYINNRTKVCIICPKHGEFLQTPDSHLRGCGCPKCKSEKLSKIKTITWDDLVCKMKEKHNNIYTYDKSSYIDTHHKIKIICPIHGEFWQTPHSHLSGHKCPKCYETPKLTKEEFIEKARKVHGDKYDYSKVEYINNRTKICIICPKHGEFWQSPYVHLSGCGCQKCNESHLELEIRKAINKYDLDCIGQKKFEWLGRQSLDFYLPKYNAAIECQGKQHFGLGGWSKETNFENLKKLDACKKQFCEEHGVKLYYFSHENFDEFLGVKVYHKIEELFNEIFKV